LKLTISDAIDRLNRQLPLTSRQQSLSTDLLSLHRALLHSFIQQGRPLDIQQIRDRFPAVAAEQAVHYLAELDLAVLDPGQREVVGCYPVTTEKTPHHIRVGDKSFYAMCALDALSIGPLFHVRVTIDSRCSMTQVPIHLVMQDNEFIESQPASGVLVGIRWQPPRGAAAHSMCREMVFLHNDTVVDQWQQMHDTDCSVFTLSEAVELGRGFFSPLL
jgi:mercuric reductase